MMKSEKASLSVMRIAVITIFTIFILSACVLASSTNMKNIKIVLADNCEIDVLTTKTLVSDILEENHIVVLPEESVVPNLDSEITESFSKIVITGITQESYSVASMVDEENDVILDKLLGAYTTVTEKMVTQEEEIPYETVTPEGQESSAKYVTRQGENGLKKCTYKVKYQNDIEIDRELINEEIVNNAVDQVMGTEKKTVKNTLPTAPGTSLENKVQGIEPIKTVLNASAYAASTCGKSIDSPGYGHTASGAMARCWHTVAAGKAYPFGTIVYIPYFASQPNRRMVCCRR